MACAVLQIRKGNKDNLKVIIGKMVLIRGHNLCFNGKIKESYI